MKRNITFWTSIVLTLTLAFTITGCSSSGKKENEKSAAVSETGQETAEGEIITLNIGFSSSDGTADTNGTLGIAIHQGFLEEELAKVNAKAELFGLAGAGPAVNEALAAKSLDVGFMGSTPATTGKAADIDTKVIAVNNTDIGGSIFTLSDSGIETVEDLKGKKVGVTRGTAWQLSFDQALELYGMTEADVEVVNLTLADLWEALALGQVDAIENTLPNLGNNIQEVVDGNVKFVIDARDYEELDTHGYGLIRTEYLEEHPEVVQAFVNAWYRASLYAEENPDILKSEVSYGEELYDYVYPEGANASIDWDENIITYEQSVVDFMYENEQIQEKFEVADWFEHSLLENAIHSIGE